MIKSIIIDKVILMLKIKGGKQVTAQYWLFDKVIFMLKTKDGKQVTAQ